MSLGFIGKGQFNTHEDRFERRLDRLQQAGWTVKAALDLVAYNMLFIEELRTDFPEKRAELSRLTDAMNCQTSLVDLVTSPVQKKEIMKRIDEVVSDLLEGESIDQVFNHYQERIDTHSVPYHPQVLKVDIKLGGELQEHYDAKKGKIVFRELFVEPGSLKAIAPSWSESLACLAKGVHYDIKTAFPYVHYSTGH